MTLDEKEAIVSAHNHAVGLMVLVNWLTQARDDGVELKGLASAGRVVAELAGELVDQLKAIADGAAE